eukprot:88118_1
MSIIERIKDVYNNTTVVSGCKAIAIGISLYFGWDILSRIYELKVKHIPPGPYGLPIFGSFFPYFRNQCVFYRNLAVNYGSIVSFRRLNSTIIMINNSKILRQIMTKNKTVSITKSVHNKSKDGALTANDGTKSLFMVNGTEWKLRRKKVYSCLMKMLTSKYLDNILSNTIHNTLKENMNKYVNNNKIWYEYHDIFLYIAFSTLYHCNFGQQISIDDKLYKIIMNDINETLEYFPISLMITKQPWLKYTFLRNQYIQMSKLKKRREYNIRTLINKRISQYCQYKTKPLTYIDYALSEMNESQAIADILLMFAAGVETTSNTLDFAMVLIANHPVIQNKVQNELKSVFGEKKKFDLLFLNKCHLFRSLVYEIMRIHSVAGHPGLRRVDNDMYIKDNNKMYCIPKGSTIHYNISWIQRYSMNEKWKNKMIENNVNGICLENWLDEYNRFKMNDSFIAFGLGKRNCLGMQFAKNEIFIVLGFILLNYKIGICENDKDVVQKALNHMRPFSRTLEPKIGITIQKLKVES